MFGFYLIKQICRSVCFSSFTEPKMIAHVWLDAVECLCTSKLTMLHGFCNVHDAGCNSGFELLYNRFSLLHECIMRQKINLWKHNWKSSWICRLWIFSLTNVVFYKVRLKTWPKSLTLKCNGITSFKPVFCQRLVKVDFSVLVQGLHLETQSWKQNSAALGYFHVPSFSQWWAILLQHVRHALMLGCFSTKNCKEAVFLPSSGH